MLDKLINSKLWPSFVNYYISNNKGKTVEQWPLLDTFLKLDSIFQIQVFIKFIEEYFECKYEICLGDDDIQYHSLLQPDKREYIIFKGYDGFETAEDLILATFEND